MSEWTPLSKSGPPEAQEVISHRPYLCTCQDGKVRVLHMRERLQQGVRKRDWADDRGCLCGAPIAWMEVPAAYAVTSAPAPPPAKPRGRAKETSAESMRRYFGIEG